MSHRFVNQNSLRAPIALIITTISESDHRWRSICWTEEGLAVCRALSSQHGLVETPCTVGIFVGSSCVSAGQTSCPGWKSKPRRLHPAPGRRGNCFHVLFWTEELRITLHVFSASEQLFSWEHGPSAAHQNHHYKKFTEKLSWFRKQWWVFVSQCA